MFRSLVRTLSALALVVLASPSRAQVASSSVPYVLPFASEGNALELALDLATEEALSVAVAEAPAWLAFAERSAEAAQSESGPVARLTFDVSTEAPIRQPDAIVLHVLDASRAVRAEKRIEVEVSAPEALELGLPRPNPSRGRVVVPYVLPEAGRVTVEVLDVLGRRVLELASQVMPAGGHTASLDTDALAAGAYVVRLVAEGADGRRAQQVRRLTVAR